MAKTITTGTTEKLQAEHEALSACLLTLPFESPLWQDMQARSMVVLEELVRRKGTLWRATWARHGE